MDPTREIEQRQTQDYLETELKEINLTIGRRLLRTEKNGKELFERPYVPPGTKRIK